MYNKYLSYIEHLSTFFTSKYTVSTDVILIFIANCTYNLPLNKCSETFSTQSTTTPGLYRFT